jgi:hypothetical protein
LLFGLRTIRRASSDPRHVLLAGFVGGTAPADDSNEPDMNGLRGVADSAPA